MELMSPSRYFLRSRGRAVGRYSLRRQGVSFPPRPDTFKKRRRGKSQSSSSEGGSSGGKDRSPSPDKEKGKSGPQIEAFHYTGVSSDDDDEDDGAGSSKLTADEREDLAREKTVRLFLRQTHPHPFLAMDEFNSSFQGDYRYKLVKVVTEICLYWPCLGFLRLIHIIAKPKPLKTSSNLSVNDRTQKHFFARVHELPNGTLHISDCKPSDEPSKPGFRITDIIPVGCLECKLHGEDSFKEKSRSLQQLKALSEGRESAGEAEDTDSECYPYLARMRYTSSKYQKGACKRR